MNGLSKFSAVPQSLGVSNVGRRILRIPSAVFRKERNSFFILVSEQPSQPERLQDVICYSRVFDLVSVFHCLQQQTACFVIVLAYNFVVDFIDEFVRRILKRTQVRKKIVAEVNKTGVMLRA